MLPDQQNIDAGSSYAPAAQNLQSQQTAFEMSVNAEDLASFKGRMLCTTALAVRKPTNDELSGQPSDFTVIGASMARNYLADYLPLSDMHVEFTIKHGMPWSAAGKERMILSRTSFFFNMFYANTRIERKELEDGNWTMPAHIRRRFAPSPENIDYNGEHIWNYEIVGIPLHAFGHFSAMFIVGLPALRDFFRRRHTYEPESRERRKKLLSRRYGVYRMDSQGMSDSDHWVRGYMVYVYLAAVFREYDLHPLEIEDVMPIKYLESPRQKGPSCGWHTAYYFSLFTRSPSILANKLPWFLVQNLTEEAIQKHSFENYRAGARKRFAELCDKFRTEVSEASEKIYDICDPGMEA
ncbi:hypothetical protein BWQ96_08611 [Gracilariopsis chorda]|uniref:Uncharacterized protein n=3 Tax=Gracilariopsis chorda TaxID=448386 RepID=A0A2V3IKK8_9FLOR|nr:hypothetical protein BWQ96_08611 [Gracilariopsis chorda]|eukprot:PXF41660.1 hypothetical protein BWQ96_08611 [Gracilariopsis chorda]